MGTFVHKRGSRTIMQGMALILFALFALLLAGIYLGIRRRWFAPGKTAAIGVIVAMVLMTLVAFAQGNSPVQAVVVGVVLGGLFGGATLAGAWYFQSQELRAHMETYSQDAQPDDDYENT